MACVLSGHPPPSTTDFRCYTWNTHGSRNFVTGGVAPNCIFFFPALRYFFNNQFKQSTRRSIKAWLKCASIAGGGEACKQMLMLSQVSEQASGNASLDFYLFFLGGGPFWMVCAQHIENLEHKNAIWDKAMTFSPFSQLACVISPDSVPHGSNAVNS